MNRNRKQITFSLRGSPPPGLVFKFQKFQQFFREDFGGLKKRKILPQPKVWQREKTLATRVFEN